MRDHRLRCAVGLILAVCVTVAGCSAAAAGPEGSRTSFGASESVGEGAVRTYTTVDARGEPTGVGIRMSATALDGLPDTGEKFMLDLPEQASATVFDHVMLNWNPHGHEPEILFGKPHFDMHFYMTDMSSTMGIDPAASDYAARAAHLPDAKYIPRDYITPPGPLASELAVPFMGVHWMDATAGMIPGVYDFTQTFINGSWDGNYTFMEPMMTRAWLLTKPAIRESAKQPQAYQHTAYYPTVYSVRFDYATGEYDISLAEMILRQKS
ncbi:DUF5602 domain-containing protein [Rhodococcus koreensis]|uniref:TTHB210-like domain-containing protein n=1 Tax=Rhodococcus koreensis TaxID=99653 RepID=A0A1H4M146_9NOCA|nr:DUF5602 domain-containing protein [Rhodococcus koreensis]SEB76434.1 hypothetical protein SAMN04490239_1562 [Rhodococcus koreensis]